VAAAPATTPPRLDTDGPSDDSKAKLARKPAPPAPVRPSPFATIPNIFR
jgi:hypothetical protein